DAPVEEIAADEAASHQSFEREPRAEAAADQTITESAPEEFTPADSPDQIAHPTSEKVVEQQMAVANLGRLNSDDAFQQICLAFDDSSPEVRDAAAQSLYEWSAHTSDAFTRALSEATPERRRRIGASIASSGLANDAINRLTSESHEQTDDAFLLLFLMAQAGETSPLMRAIETHPNNEVRLAAVNLLTLSSHQNILPAFRRLAVRGSLPTEVRYAVMEAIYQISNKQSSSAGRDA
nr:hypothetical protein [Pyrinomonadaceae bacterium]